MSFSFVGKIPASPFLLSHALLVKSYFPEVVIEGDSSVENILCLKENLRHLELEGESFEYDFKNFRDVLSFMAPRLVRLKGKYSMSGDPKLFKSQQEKMVKVLSQLGGIISAQVNGFTVRSDGWHLMGDGVYIQPSDNDLLVSGVLLNCWDLPFQVCINTPKSKGSSYHIDRSIQFLSDLGMKISRLQGEIIISPGQLPNCREIKVESDARDVFFMSIIASLFGEAKILDISQSIVSDEAQFIHILKKTGASVKVENGVLSISKASKLFAVDVDLSHSPELIPLLSVLCTQAGGISHLKGFATMGKELRQRMDRLIELLKALGVVIEEKRDGLAVQGGLMFNKSMVDFDPASDYELLLAAQLLIKLGASIQLKNPDGLSRSLPTFLKALNVSNS